MIEDANIILLNIRHYQELLKLDRHTAETRQRLIELLAAAQAQLPLAQRHDAGAKFVEPSEISN